MRTVCVTLELTLREAQELEAAADRRGQAIGYREGFEVVRRPDQTGHWDKLARALRRAMRQTAQGAAAQPAR